MGFTLPNFNLVCNIWRNGNPTTNPPDVVTLGNLANGWRTGTIITGPGPAGAGVGGSWLLLPAGTDIRDASAPAGADVVEVPALSGRFYDVIWVDDLGLGFANEHRFAAIIKKSPWPVPFPPAPPLPPTPYVLIGRDLQTGNPPAVIFNYAGGAPGGVSQLILFQATTSASYPTAQIVSGPFLTAGFQGHGGTLGGITAGLCYFETALPGPGSSIFCQGVGDGALMGVVIVWPTPPGAHGGGGGDQTGTTSPATWSSLAPLSGVPASSFAGVGLSGVTSNGVWTAPFIRTFPTDLGWTDPNGVDWKFSAAVAQYTVITTPTPTLTESSTVPGLFGWVGGNFDLEH